MMCASLARINCLNFVELSQTLETIPRLSTVQFQTARSNAMRRVRWRGAVRLALPGQLHHQNTKYRHIRRAERASQVRGAVLRQRTNGQRLVRHCERMS